jgi:hypothetical protein
MGADLGFGVPIVAFQIKATEADPTIKYEIYSLDKPAKLLRTISGQGYFSAADTRLDGTIEIWTTDAVAVNGFDNLPRSAFDTPPTVVLRFEDEKLTDVSSEFREYYDQQIDALRSQLDPEQLSDFKASDGRLSGEPLSPNGRPTGLLATKVKVLEIVWAYLYSERDQEAWHALDQMWPSSDADRVRTAIANARERGLCSQVDAVSHLTAPRTPSNSSAIYKETISFGFGILGIQDARLADTVPRQILLRIPSPRNPQQWDEVKHLELVIDDAGKVRSARMVGMKDSRLRDDPSKKWIEAAAGWKYIPAFKDGHPKASHCRGRVFRNR